MGAALEKAKRKEEKKKYIYIYIAASWASWLFACDAMPFPFPYEKLYLDDIFMNTGFYKL